MALKQFTAVGMTVAVCLMFAGCSGERTPVNEKPVVPVSGVVHVNGKPTGGIKIKFHVATPDASHRVFPKASTDADGKFKTWTYRIDDGLPPGEYSITFTDLSQKKPMQRESNVPDGFRGAYSNPEQSEFKLTVTEGQEPIVMDPIELTR